ncbi:MAG: twin-arginine translocase subunit TatC [Burkholderiaceae bacterium]
MADTFISHLIELRNRLVWATAVVVVVFLGLTLFAAMMYDMVAAPMMKALPSGSKFIAPLFVKATQVPEET